MKSRTTTGLVAVVAVVAGTAGCSAATVARKAADESAETVVQALSHVSDEASKAGSAEISATMAGPATGGKTVTMKGLYSWGDGGLAMETAMPAKDVRMEHLVKDGTVTVRLVNGSYYYRVDPVDSGPYAGKSWLKVEAAAVVGEQGAAGMAQGQGDPTAGLKGLKYAKDAAWVGVESVNGKNTKHYRASIPAAKMGSAADDMRKTLGLSGDVVMDVWLDEKGAPARLNQVIGTTSISLDFLSFGGTRTVEVPPAADVADLTAVYREQKEGKAA
ncbi:lipoprotein [Streptomyces polychromogenes]|uniref:Lipoprotein n=1 Tax=Streptomyces polychromogenes TaxID=67342 RepID=A0ABP3F3R1_9ACTN